MKVMLLIDADNVSVELAEQAIERLLQEYGALHVRRAYCTAESAVKNQSAFKRLGIRPMVNLAAGKNSTDIALAVDALDLALTERPDVVVIASSDSDFAPLVGRLREKGCRVRGIGQQGKTGAETQQVYDDFLLLTHRGETAAASATGRTARKTASRTRERTPKATGTRAAAKTVGRSRASAAAAGSTSTQIATPTPPPPPPPDPTPVAAMPDRVRSVLAALPELRHGQAVELRVAAERLRDAELLGARASSTKFFAPLAAHFELLPADQPNKLRWRGA